MGNTTIDGVIEVGWNARYKILDEMPQVFTISTDITTIEPHYGNIFQMGDMEIRIVELGGIPYLYWGIFGDVYDNFQLNFPYNHYNLICSFDSTNTARVYINGSLVRSYTFKASPTFTYLYLGDEAEYWDTAKCYIDELTIYDYAFTGETADTSDLTADFKANITGGGAPLRVQFTDLSTSLSSKIVAWNWNFGDGNFSTSSEPDNTYEEDGKYHVSLIVTDANGVKSTETKQFYITVAGTITDLKADFMSDVVKGEPPLTVYFEDCSQSPNEIINWQWNFDYDNQDTIDSTLQNASHTYTEEAIYTVSLNVVDSTLTHDVETKRQYIWCQENHNLPPTAAFIEAHYIAAPDIPVVIRLHDSAHFWDLSTNMETGQAPLSWSWDFGDDTTSTLQNPWHTYNSLGTFTVSLTVTNAYGSDSETKTAYVTVETLDCLPPTPQFICDAPYLGFQHKQIDVNSPIQFTDTSYNVPTTWLWDFGDGQTSSVQNPSHTYTKTGDYDVSLYVTSECGSNKLTQYNYITVCDAVTANFISDTMETASTIVNFYDQSEGDITKWIWNFGDGRISEEQNPQHRYPINPTRSNKLYTVSLTVYSGATYDTKIKSNYITVLTTEYDDDYPDPPAPGSLFLRPRAGEAPLKVDVITEYLNAYKDKGFAYRILWGDGTTWETFISSHHYLFTGTYNVKCEIFNGTYVFKTLYNTVTVIDPSNNDREVDDFPYPPLNGNLFLYPRAGASPLTVTVLTKHIIPYINNGYSYKILWSETDTEWEVAATTHSYSGGTYHARLQIYREDVAITQWENIITVGNASESIYQFVSPISNYVPSTVYIIKGMLSTLSTTYVRYEVNWGDSTPVEPSATHHFYGSAGTYVITITFYDMYSVATSFQNTVYVNEWWYVTDFTADKTYLPSGQTLVSFTNQSVYDENSSWLWKVGNTSNPIMTSTERSPTFTFATENQTYDVTLYREDDYVNIDTPEGASSYVISKPDYIKTGGVQAQLAIKIKETEDSTDLIYTNTAYVNDPVYLYGTVYSDSIPTSLTYHFGDGTTLTTDFFATTVDPNTYTCNTTHTYTKCFNGNCTPYATVTNSTGVSSSSTNYNDGNISPNYVNVDNTYIGTYNTTLTVIEKPSLPYNKFTLQTFTNTTGGNLSENIVTYNASKYLYEPEQSDNSNQYLYFNPIYIKSCTNFNSDLSFVNQLSSAMILDPNDFYYQFTPDNYTGTNDLKTYFPKCFAVKITFKVDINCVTGVLLSSGDASINIHGPIYNNMDVTDDERIKISFNETPPQVPYTIDTEFILSPNVDYTVILISKDMNYGNATRKSSVTDCGNQLYTVFVDIPRETNAYLLVNNHYYLLGTFDTDPSAIYLGRGVNTLGAAYNTKLSEVKTYNYDPIYSSRIIPITNYKITEPLTYWNYVKDDFPGYDCTSKLTDYTFVDPTSGTYPLTVTVDQNKLSYKSFGDIYYVNWGDSGTWQRYGKTHEFATGTFLVTANIYEVTNNTEVLAKTLTSTVIVSPTYSEPVVDFTAETSIDNGVNWTSDRYVGIAVGDPNVIVRFTNTSTENAEDGVASYLWRFADGSTSTEKNPQHTYSTTGVYDVTLVQTTSITHKSTSTRRDNFIQIFYTDFDPTVIFDMYYDYDNTDTTWIKSTDNTSTDSLTINSRTIKSYKNPTNVKFTNLTTNVTGVSSWVWDFGDGTTSTSLEPTHSYTDYGIYSVTLTATLPGGNTKTSTINATVYIIDSSDYTPDEVAEFKAYGQNIYGNWVEQTTFTELPATVKFDITQWSDFVNGIYGWNYGDGTTSRDSWTTTHQYTTDGDYSVTVYASAAISPYFTEAKQKEAYIHVDSNMIAPTRYYIGKGAYETTSAYLTNIALTGTLSQEEFELLISNDDIYFETFDSQCNCPFFSWGFVYTGYNVSSPQYYIIMAVNEPKTGTPHLYDKLNLDVYNNVKLSYVNYTHTDGTVVPIKLMVIPYPINTISDKLVFNYKMIYR